MEPGSAGADIAQERRGARVRAARVRCGKRFGSGVTDVVLVVPGAYRTEQLGLLLGLAQECGMPVRALVDAAAAASVRPYPKRQLVYVDAGLYRVVGHVDRAERRSAGARRARARARASRRSPTRSRAASRTCSFARRASIRSRTPRRSRSCTTVCREWLEALQREERVEVDAEVSRRGVSCRGRARCRPRRRAAAFYRAVIATRRSASRTRQAARRADVGSRRGAAGFHRRARRGSTTRRSERFAPGHAARSVLLAREPSRRARHVKLLKRLPWREAPRDDAGASAAPPEPAAPVSRARSRRRTSCTAASRITSAPKGSRSVAKRTRSGAPGRARRQQRVSRLHCEVSCATASSSCAT